MRRRTSEQIARLFELSLDLLVLIGPDRRVVAANPSWERVLGYPPAVLEGTSLMELIHPDDVEETRRGAQELRDGEHHREFENRYRHAAGHWVWLHWSSVTSAEDGTIYAAARDVTAERGAKEEARQAVERLEEAQRAARIGSWEIDARTGARFYTREMYLMNGLDPDRDRPWDLVELLDHVPPEDRQPLRRVSRRVLTEPGPHRVQFRMTHAPGRLFESSMEAERDAAGTAVVVRGTTQDVTELRENERRLAEAEELAGIGSFEYRVSTRRLLWSPGAYRLFGMDPSGPTVTREAFYRLMLPEEAERAEAQLRRAVAEQTPFEIEYTLPTGPNGTRIAVVGRGVVHRDDDGHDTILRGTIQDVTRERLAIRQQQEIARLGQLALAGTDLRELFEEVCRVVNEVLGTDVCNVLAVQGDGSLAFAASAGLGEGMRGTAIEADKDSIVRLALANDGPMIVTDWLTDDRFPYSAWLQANGVRCTAVLPIRGREGPFGILATHGRTPGPMYDDQNLAFLDALATFLTTAIERLRHEAEIAGLAALRGRLVAENLEAEERARQRISEELHDGALQDLLAARQDLVEAEGPDSTTRQEMLGYAREGVERAVRRLRDAVHALHPVVLQHGGLEAAMQAAADQAARQGGFRPEVNVDADAAGLRDELVMSLARELLTNAAKHAEADTVHVAVRRQNGALVLEVADDGRGVDPAAVAAAPLNGHIGLASLVQRVEAVGGTFDLEAGEGGGTTVRARLPIG
jgi:PAS domain S-box-containing protein